MHVAQMNLCARCASAHRGNSSDSQQDLEAVAHAMTKATPMRAWTRTASMIGARAAIAPQRR